MRLRPWMFLLSGAALVVGAACQVIAGIDDRRLYVATSEAGADSSVDGGNCRGLNVPSAPDLSTSNPADAIEVVTALSTLDLGLDGGKAAFGFNLDRACTCPESDTCQRPIGSNGKKLPPACDDPNGVDNAGRPLFGLFSSFVNQKVLNDAIAAGLASVFLRVQHYNGLPDDAVVEVSVYASLGFAGYPDAGPKFDGTDVWVVDQGSTENGNLATPHYKANEAYVRDGTLVASLKFPIVLGGGIIQPVTVELESGKIVAKLDVSNGQVTRIHGQLAGRWQVSKLLTSLQNVPDPFDKTQRLCGTDSIYLALKPRVCESVDIASDPTNDGTGICDAVSLGFGFDAIPAVFGQVKPQPPPTNPCGPGYAATCP